jgi:hypothetical protein
LKLSHVERHCCKGQGSSRPLWCSLG